MGIANPPLHFALGISPEALGSKDIDVGNQSGIDRNLALDIFAGRHTHTTLRTIGNVPREGKIKVP
jgi:hypothetical protein